MSVKVTHNAGFFSCCSVKLQQIVEYINTHKKLPVVVDSSSQFKWYKQDENNTDITYEYFEHYDTNTKITFPIDYRETHQFKDYSKLKYSTIVPLITKYFSPSINIRNIITMIEQKYTLDYENTCVLFYRGNDKNRETNICTYEEYITYANIVLRKNPNIKFLLQSDETEFIEKMMTVFPNKTFYFKDEIRHVKTCDSTVDKIFKETNPIFSKYYLAITIIMSKCKYIVCGSGNCSIWIMLYRGNCHNVYQYLHNKFLSPRLPFTA
jgi:hypothetical protein